MIVVTGDDKILKKQKERESFIANKVIAFLASVIVSANGCLAGPTVLAEKLQSTAREISLHV